MILKKTFQSLVLIIMLLTLWSCSKVIDAVVFNSVIMNQGFENSVNGLPEGWNFDAKVQDKGSVKIVSNKAGNILLLKPNKYNTGSDLLGVGQMLTAQSYRGKQLIITADLGAEGGSSAIVGVHLLGGNGNLGYIQFRQGNNDGNLKTHTDKLTIPKDAEHIIVYAIVSGTTGTAYFDNINFKLDGIKSIPDSKPKLGNSAQIVVDLNSVIRTVPASLLGTNVEWIYNGQGLWNERTGSLDGQAISLATELGVTMLRFPGGVFSDYYQWKNGIGEQDKRPKSLHYPNGPKSANNFGSNEVVQFAKAINAELLITVNAGHGTAQQAAEWVKYLANKKANVAWWEIGNELYMDNDLTAADLNAKQYTQLLKKFSDAMHKVDPDIKIGAIGGLNYGRYSFVKQHDWNKTVLEGAADKIDFLAVHNAYAPVMIGVPEGTSGVDVYKAMLAAPLNIAQNLIALDQQLSQYESRKNSIKLAVTEWGPFFHVLPSSPWVDHIKTLGSALFVSSTLNTFFKQPRLEIATFFKLTDHGFMGWIGNRGDAFLATAPFYAFKLYNQAIGGEVVEAKVISGNFDSRSIGVVDAVKNVPFVDALAVKMHDGVLLYLVNKNFNNEIKTEIAIKGLATVRKLEVKLIKGTAIDANTGTKPPIIPGLVWAPQVIVKRFDKGGPNEVLTLTSTHDLELTAKENSSLLLSQTLPAASITRLYLKSSREPRE